MPVKKQNLYVFHLCRNFKGRGVVAAASVEHAEHKLHAEYGANNIESVEDAAEQELSEIRALGGFIPSV